MVKCSIQNLRLHFGYFSYINEESNKKYTRKHKTVLRAIRELKCSEEFRGEDYFQALTYTYNMRIIIDTRRRRNENKRPY